MSGVVNVYRSTHSTIVLQSTSQQHRPLVRFISVAKEMFCKSVTNYSPLANISVNSEIFDQYFSVKLDLDKRVKKKVICYRSQWVDMATNWLPMKDIGFRFYLMRNLHFIFKIESWNSIWWPTVLLIVRKKFANWMESMTQLIFHSKYSIIHIVNSSSNFFRAT